MILMKIKLTLFLFAVCLLFSSALKADIGITNNTVEPFDVHFIGGVVSGYQMPANSYGYHLVIPSQDFKWSCPGRYCILQIEHGNDMPGFTLGNIFTDLTGDNILNIEPDPYITGKYTITQDSQNSITITSVLSAKK